MRNLKKALALVLALMMALSLMAVASASEFTDDSSIEKNEAVDVMNAIGVFQGEGDNNFNPKGELTRAQAAKIISYMLLGQAVADALPKDESPFPDVRANNWNTGYIAFASNEGIIDGRTNGNFDPKDKLTGYEFGKMVLLAAGIKGEYTGSNWKMNVNIALQSAKLLDGVGMATLAPYITREQACQLAFNGLLYAPNAQGTGRFKITHEDGSGSLHGTVCDSRTEALMLISVMDNANASKYTIEEEKDTSGSLADVVFGLKSTSGTTPFGATGTQWQQKDSAGQYKDLVLVANKPVLSYDTKLTSAKLFTDLGKPAQSALGTVTVKVDGKALEGGSVWNKADIAANGTKEVGGNGAQISVYRDGNNVTIVVVNTYLGKIATHTDAKGDDKEAITLTPDGSVKPTGTFGKFETTKFTDEDKGAAVLYTATTDGTDVTIQNVWVPQEATGTVTRMTGTTSFIMGGVTYKYSDKKANTIASGNVGKEATVYLDESGYVIGVKAAEEAKANLAVVTAAGKEQATWNTQPKYMVTLLLSDRTQVDKEIAKLNNVNASDDNIKAEMVGKIYTYVESNGKVELTTLTTTPNSDGLKLVTLGKGTKDAPGKIERNKPTLTAGAVADKDTLFLISNEDGTKLSPYTGISSVPSTRVAVKSDGTDFVEGAADFQIAVDGNGVAKLVYVARAQAIAGESTSNDVIFVTGEALSVNDADLGAHKEYAAVINGEIKTLNADNSCADLNGLYKSVTENDKGLVTSATAMQAADKALADAALVGVEVQGSNIKVGSSAFVYGDNTKVFVADGGEISEIAVSAIETDGNDKVWGYTDKDGVLAMLFIEKVAGSAPAHTHSMAKTNAKDATCTEDGNKEYWSCTTGTAENGCDRFGKYYTAEAAEAEVEGGIEISATGHTPVQSPAQTTDYVQGTDNNVGKHCVKCSTCNQASSDSWETCDTNGSESACSKCGYKAAGN